MPNYLKFKEIRQKAYDNFLNKFAFFAFNNRQFDEGVAKVQARMNRKGKLKLSRLPGGGFILNNQVHNFLAFCDNWDRYEKKILEDEKRIIDGLIYEYGNHEAQINQDSKEDAEALFPMATESMKKKAWKKFWADCIKYDRF